MLPKETDVNVGDHVKVIDGKYKGRTGIVDQIILNRAKYTNVAVVYFDDEGTGTTSVANLKAIEE